MRTHPSLLLICALFAPHALVAQTTAFTYQGQLNTGGSPANGLYEISFALYDAPTNGNVVGTPVTIAPLSVTNGLFSATLDFGAGAFTGANRWIEISVTVFGSDQPVVNLVPRQPILPTPYALHAANAAGLMSFAGAPLDIKVNGERALRLEATTNGLVNIVAGAESNHAQAGVVGATIGGGGALSYEGFRYTNEVRGDFGTIAGGADNSTAGRWATVGGGLQNISEGHWTTICGGWQNLATGDWAVITGGYGNTNSGEAGFVGGGRYNTVAGGGAAVGGGFGNTAGGAHAVISGGLGNTSSGLLATIGGGVENVCSGEFATLGGGRVNVASGNWSTTGGGHFNIASNDNTTVAGGAYNVAGGQSSSIGGGTSNHALESSGTVGGGNNNEARGPSCTVGGGEANRADGSSATVAGGQENQVLGSYSVIAGGNENHAEGGFNAIGGGDANTISDGDWSVVGGGRGNLAASSYAAVGGGGNNRASGYGATVAGGGGLYFDGEPASNTAGARWSTVGGGALNAALGTNSTIGGGSYNVARGENATIPGGYGNNAEGAYSFAAGENASADHPGAFVWADAAFVALSSTTNNQFTARASGGVRFFTDTNATTGAELAPGSGTWSSLSDRNAKENFAAANAREILDKVTALPMGSWNYKAQDKSVRHLGPMAQDFHAAFGLGESERTITTVDADGVALAAIQGLNAKLEEELKTKDARIGELERRLAGIERMLSGTAAK